jgi:tRNA nucleotidyltransferase (CCA-adding enzyme)
MDLLAQLRAQPGGERLLAVAPAGAYLVGGAVRDLLLGRSPRELDVVVEGDFSALAHVLGTAVEHPRFGTAIVELEDVRIDVAGARRELYQAPGALPEVEQATLDEDLKRRDFTVNAIAVTIGGEHPGEIHAAPGALEDLAAGRLRVLHDQSFVDDPTRLLRLARYKARLGFEVEDHTAELAQAAIATRALETVSGARIGAELRLALAEGDAVASLAALSELGVLGGLHPRLRFEEPVARATLELLPKDGRPDLALLASVVLPLALRAQGDPRTEIITLLDRWDFPAGDRDRVAVAAIAVPRLLEELPAAMRPSAIRAAAQGVPPEGVALAGALGCEEPARRWLEQTRHVDLEITGDDLVAAGIPEGPEIGQRLEAVLKLRLDGELLGGRKAELRAALADGPEVRSERERKRE